MSESERLYQAARRHLPGGVTPSAGGSAPLPNLPPGGGAGAARARSAPGQAPGPAARGDTLGRALRGGTR